MLPRTDYLAGNKDALLPRLSAVWVDLCNAHTDLGTTEQRSLQARLDGMQQSPSESVSGQKRDAEYASYSYDVEAIKLRSEIAAYEEERDFILFLLTNEAS